VTKRWKTQDTVRFIIAIVTLAIIDAFLYVRYYDKTVAWVFTMVSLAVVVAVIGKGVTDVWYGPLVDERNQMSLSRLQLYLWFIIILSGWIFLALSANTVDISVPQQVLGLLGISSVTAVAAVGIDGNKKNEGASQEAGNSLTQQLEAQKEELKPEAPDAVSRQGVLVTYTDPKQASLADLFTGEEIGNALSVDPGKVQMFFFTLLVAIAYATQVGREIALHQDALPSISPEMVALLGISHAGYLGTKYAPSTRTHPVRD
jgi:hypothetical protein